MQFTSVYSCTDEIATLGIISQDKRMPPNGLRY